MSPAEASPLPRVCAILVVQDGEQWLPSVLATLAAQRYPALGLVVVDNASTDEGPALLARRVPPERLLTLPRRVGFGRAVAAAMRHDEVGRAEMVLLLHDDLVLAPDAIARLVQAFRRDASLGIAGPKLREWEAEPVLQEVGMTVDRFGRAETLLEPRELDQGQHDQQREVLYVSTAGMLVKTELLRSLRGFDARYPALRDDLDLCWRAWIAGARVEVVPAAVGYHVAAASRGVRRLGRRGGASAGRALAERHTVATLLKCYGPLRLAWVLPLLVLLAVLKVVGFLASRRVGDALAVARAYSWNLTHLPRTLRRRRVVQRSRVRSDGELTRLFAPGLPRARAYTEAATGWLAGGGTKAILEDPDPDALEPPATESSAPPLVQAVRRHPAAFAGGLLAVVYVLGLVPLLGAGQLVGGEVAPWPASALDFLRAYASPWNGDPLASPATASPTQPVLGILALAGLGSTWLAQRLVVLGLLPLAWATALRAGRLVTARPAPRVLGATLYSLSPVLLGALARGYLGVLVVAALLPGLVVLAVRVVAPGELRAGASPSQVTASAWRAAALLTLGLVVGIGAAPRLWPLMALLLVVTLAAAVLRREGLERIAVVLVAGGLLLAPWLLGMARQGLPPSVVDQRTLLPLWRAFAVVPEVLPGLGGLAGVLNAVTAIAVLVSALLLGFRSRPGVVTGFAAVLVASSLVAWAVARLDIEGLWTPALLLPSALAQAGLGVVAARWVARGLRGYAFGARQLAVVGSLGLVAIGLVAGVARLATGPYDGLARAPQLLPPFVTADEPLVGPYRVLLLRESEAGVEYEVVSSGGVSMIREGTIPSRMLLDAVEGAVAGVVGGVDPGAGARLGVLGVRYVVVDLPDDQTVAAGQAVPEDAAAPEAPAASETPDPAPGVLAEDASALIAAIEQQPALQPVPSGAGQVYRTETFLPRAVVLPPQAGESLLATGDPGPTADVQEQGLAQSGQDTYVGVAPSTGGLLVVSEATSDRWHAASGDQPLERREPGPGTADSWAVNAFAVPEGIGQLTVQASAVLHVLTLVLQVLVVLAVLSLAIRPPGIGQGRVRRPGRSRGRPPVVPEDVPGPAAGSVPGIDETPRGGNGWTGIRSDHDEVRT